MPGLGTATLSQPVAAGRDDEDDRLLSVIAAVLFVSSFSWWSASVSTYAAGGIGGTQLIFRVIPVGASGLALLLRDAKAGFPAMGTLFAWPVLALIWYALVGALAGASSPLPKLALWKGIEIAGIAYFAAHCARLPADRLERLVERILKFAILLVLWVAATAIIDPGSADASHTSRFMLRGYIPIINSNGLGTWAAIALVALAGGVRVVRRPGLHFWVMAIVAVVLILAQSRTGFLAAAFGFGVLGVNLLRTDRDRGLILIATAAVSAGVALLGIERLFGALARGQSLESLRTLSGRLDYWGVGLQVITERPLLGGGLATGSRFLAEMFADVFRGRSVNLHSAPIEIFLSAGLVGGLPLFVFFAATALRGFWGTLTTSCTRGPCLYILASALAIMLVPRFFLSIAMASFSAELLLVMLVGLILRRTHGAAAVPAPAEATSVPSSETRAGRP